MAVLLEDGKPYCQGAEWVPPVTSDEVRAVLMSEHGALDWMRYAPKPSKVCGACGGKLQGRMTWCCTKECLDLFSVHHFWANARPEAWKRRPWCVMCWPAGSHHALFLGCYRYDAHNAHFSVVHTGMEINHIEPRRGRGYSFGCHHHQSNLEPLCVRHHGMVSSAQKRAARDGVSIAVALAIVQAERSPQGTLL